MINVEACNQLLTTVNTLAALSRRKQVMHCSFAAGVASPVIRLVRWCLRHKTLLFDDGRCSYDHLMSSLLIDGTSIKCLLFARTMCGKSCITFGQVLWRRVSGWKSCRRCWHVVRIFGFDMSWSIPVLIFITIAVHYINDRAFLTNAHVIDIDICNIC